MATPCPLLDLQPAATDVTYIDVAAANCHEVVRHAFLPHNSRLRARGKADCSRLLLNLLMNLEAHNWCAWRAGDYALQHLLQLEADFPEV
jgi:hypothetical protein